MTLSPEAEVRSEPETDFATGDPNLALLRQRMALTGVLALVTTGMVFTDPLRVVVPGAVSALGLGATSLAACWAGALVPLNRRLLLIMQLAVDVLVIGLLVNFTGGPFSILPLAFCVPILLGAYYHGPRASMALAGLAAIFTGGGHFGLALGWLLAGQSGSLEYLQGWPVMVTALHMSLFVIVGLVSGSLAGRLLRQRGRTRLGVDALARSRCEVNNILENIRSGLLTVDSAGCITRLNPAAETILGLDARRVLGRSLEGIARGGMEEFAARVLAVAKGGQPLARGELIIQCAGVEKPLGLNANPLRNDHGVRDGAIVIFTDLTREKAMTARIREADRMAAVGEMAASIAHEIRNPLASIRGSVELLAGELDLEGNLDQLLSLVLKESGRVNTIINDFLAYSRMRPTSLRRFSAEEFLGEVELQAIQHVVANGGKVEVDFRCEPADLEVRADPSQLTQLVLNLVINACEAMEYAGKIELTLAKGSDSYLLEISDTGPGIDADMAEDLYTPFKTTKEKGTGLGLAMVARIAAAHDGQVRAENRPGGGACFKIDWPATSTADDQTVEPADLCV
ncbi:hypothetical protein COW53_09045 [bacterium CG17_big_fil_post_rev_8_21_14_2_50_64_8]|nr:MAG: hypothetical protein COW53_09045 [bacterium CG17_big_fil_post_rev_8_21_14_2_50_64_8]PJA75639.1 MAG: hypothetical protein CO151_05475 [bacterium CG_4_9_14_3_um_filter_65_15]